MVGFYQEVRAVYLFPAAFREIGGTKWGTSMRKVKWCFHLCMTKRKIIKIMD